MVDDIAHGRLNVYVCVFCADFAAYYHETGAAECLAGYLGFLVLSEEFIQNCV